MASKLPLLSLAVFVALAWPCEGQRQIWTLRGGAPGDLFGSSVSAAGDANEDGFADFIVGSPLASGTGQAYVYSGKDGSLLLTLTGQNAGDLFGVGVSYAEDMNGDGVFELIIGAGQTATTKLGYVQVFSGKDGALLHTVQGTRDLEQLGAYVANMDDVNGDGIPDFAAGAPAFLGEVVASLGTVLVCSGADGSIIYDFRGDDFGGFGYYMRCAGDVNNDGVADMVTGAPFDSTTKVRAGMARVFSGKDGSIIHTLYGQNEYDHFGVSNGGLGDLNQDGHADFLVGSYGSDIGGLNRGAVWVYSGKDLSVLHVFHGDSEAEDFGFASSGLKDMNGDGFKDILIGARFDDVNGLASGSARIYSGRTGNLLYEMFGETTRDQIGRSVKYAADVDNDGFNDAIVGAYTSDDSGVRAGKAVVLAGDDLFVNASRKTALPGDVLSLTTAEGVPGAPTLLAAVEVNGIPIFHPVGGIGTLDANGVRTLSATIPSGLSGTVVSLRAYALNAQNKIIDSSDEKVRFF